MFNTKRCLQTFILLGSLAILVIPPIAAATTKSVGSGATWEVTGTTRLSELTIADGAAIKGPEGYNVTMSVDGVGTAIEAGDFKGDIVLTVTEKIEMAASSDISGGGPPSGDGERGMPGAPEGGMPGGPEGGMPGGGGPRRASLPWKAALYVENGKYIAEKSVASVVAGEKVTDTAAADIEITSNEGNFNGIIVTGDAESSYSIDNPAINLNGNGGDDATGQGMGILVSGNADVTVDNARIVTHGNNRSAILVRGHGTVHVNNSEIETYNGVVDESATSSIGDGVMSFGPWLLGIQGKVRATNVIESGTAYYYNTHIKSQAWGALSTDGPVHVRLYATKCTIDVEESGYGAYSIGDSIVSFSDCTLNIPDYAMIVCDYATGIFTDGTVVNSGRIGVMMHDGSGGGMLTIDKGTVFNTKSTVIQIKGRRGANIFVDNAELNSESGVILQTMANDDPNMSDFDRIGGGRGFSRDVQATFSNMALDGDIINGFTRSGNVIVTFRNASIKGAITTSTVSHVLGPNGEKITSSTPELYYLIGQVNNTYGPKPEDPYGITVLLDENSTWVVDKTSYLTALNVTQGATITAPEGYSVTMTVDGKKMPIGGHNYGGQIVLTVTKNS